jgi:AsmA protein
LRTVKFLAALVGGIIVLIVAGLFAAWLFVHPNDYKGRIAAAVKESTGRDLVLKGDIKLSVFPWIALELGPASLGNPPGFGEEPFLAFNHAAVRVGLWPLLSKRLDIQRVDIDGLDLRLRKNAQGIGNWQDVGGPRAREPAAPEGAKSGGPLPELAGLRVTDGRVSYQGNVIEHFDLEAGSFSGHGATPVRIGFDAQRGVPGESVNVSGKFNLAVADDTHVRLEALRFTGTLSRPGDGRPARWELSVPAIEADLSQHTVAVPAFAASYANAHLTGKLQATKITEALSMTGSAALAPLSLRELAPILGLALPRTRDARAFAELAASSDFAYDPNGVSLDHLQAQLDDTHMKGTAAMAGEPRAIKFDLSVDQINVDRYLGPDKGTAAVPKPAETSAPDAAAAKGPDANGTLTVAAVHFSPMDFTDVRLTLAAKDNVLHIYPAQAQIDGGSYSGNVTLDRRAVIPTLSMDEHLSGVDMARLLAGSSYKGRLSGRGTVNLKATARGTAFEAVMQTLNGHFDANVSQGALEGIDLGYDLKAAQALIKHEAQPARSTPARTKFDAVKMSAEISNGIARTSDLTISSAVLRVTGQGSANLANKGIDFQMLASVREAPGASLADIPLKVTGTYVDPTVRPDTEALAKGELKQKLKDVLKKNGLEGLFGK